MKREPKCMVTGAGSKVWHLPVASRTYLHRLDGPAIEWANGTKDWFIDNKHLIGEEVERWLEENEIDLKTKEGQMAFKLRFS